MSKIVKVLMIGLELGGTMISPNEALDSPDAKRKMSGSLIIFEAELYAEVKALIENDIYWIGNVVRTI